MADEMNLNVAPAPVSPETVPGIGASPEVGAGMGAPAGAELSQEQMKTNLQELMSKIESKYGEVSATKASADNESRAKRSEILREIFDMFEAQGVDPNDPESVGAFLDKLKQSNPEVYQQVDQALRTLLGDSPELEAEAAPMEQAAMAPEAAPAPTEPPMAPPMM